MNINRKSLVRVLGFFAGIILLNLVAFSTASAQHQCDHHTEDWHQHASDGYWQAWWKIIDWDSDIVNQLSEETLVDTWDRLLDLEFRNEDCDVLNIVVERQASFTHSVTIDWGGEVHADLEGGVKLLFQNAKAKVGAKVSWHRSGTSIKDETITVKQTKPLSECKEIDFYYDVRRLRKKYKFEVAEAEFQCKNFDSGVTKWFTCNRRVMKCTAQGYHEVKTGWVNSKKICTCENGVVVSFTDPG